MLKKKNNDPRHPISKEGVKTLDYPRLVEGANDFREEGFEIVLGVPEGKCIQGSDRASCVVRSRERNGRPLAELIGLGSRKVKQGVAVGCKSNGSTGKLREM